ncbi:hypothetical protein [Psychrobacillus sp. FSL H8-0510]|uniref:hypothetical protein n=1 Tax=Psychrobacillus sp. FSL H8-0510 TaxID=2921394 RepID=UPI0030FC8A1F
MNWDLIIGLIIGLSGSILGLIGTIWSNKQNNKHSIDMLKLNQKEEFRRFVLDTSYKEYEFRTNTAIKLSDETGSPANLYPFDMYLATYTKINEYLEIEKATNQDLNSLLNEMEQIRQMYLSYNKQKKNN